MTLPVLDPTSLRSAVAELRTADATLGRMIDRVGPCGLAPRFGGEAWPSLFRAIVYQQLATGAATAIYDRVLATCDARDTAPPPQRFLEATDEQLRAAGLSRNKLAALRDLAARTIDGTVPSRRRATGMSDEALIAHLTQVRGIGRWTAEMYLMFGLGRPDVLPLADLGIRKGYAITFRRRELPEAETIARRAKRWRPWRTVASWYLWRAVDGG